MRKFLIRVFKEPRTCGGEIKSRNTKRDIPRELGGELPRIWRNFWITLNENPHNIKIRLEKRV
jgi:hypothetical protein